MNSLTNRKIVIAGGSGFLGISLASHLSECGADVVILSRRKPIDGPWSSVLWDGRTTGEWCQALHGSAGLVNLAGRTVNCIKTPDHQDEILRSRVESTRALGAAMRMIETPPPVWVQMSTAHIYGDPPSAVCTEDSAFGLGLAPTVAKAWEQALEDCVLPEQREVRLRTSFVVGQDRGAGKGALEALGLLARVGLGGRVGKGTQGMSWIHELDMNRIIETCLLDESMCGPYIASSPQPVSQIDFMRELRKAVGMPIGLPAFEWMVRIGAPLLMKTDPELALYGRYVHPARLLSHGFAFEFPALSQALRDVVA